MAYFKEKKLVNKNGIADNVKFQVNCCIVPDVYFLRMDIKIWTFHYGQIFKDC